jgi:fumarylacetoacetase
VSGPGGCWVPVPDGSHFPVQNLPYGVFSRPGEPPRAGAAIGGQVLDLAGLAEAGLLDRAAAAAGAGAGAPRRWFSAPALNGFLAAGPAAWRDVRARLTELLRDPAQQGRVASHLVPRQQVVLRLPFAVADYVDFYSSRHHAEAAGRILRPGTPPLPRNWLHLPAGYHGRAGSVVVSGTPVTRPCGQCLPPGEQAPVFGPSERLDFEAEVGFVVGVPSRPGEPVPVAGFRSHVFGFLLVNDWSARDIQAFESQPLGPFLAKSFATSVSPWVVPAAALEAARVPPPRQDPGPLPYLRCPEPWGLDLRLEVSLNGQVISRPPARELYWTPPQQLAHATVNGAPLRTGDLFASGTVSGPGPAERGCLLELTWDGTRPLALADGTSRSYLLDGDTVRITATAPGAEGATIGFGEVEGTVIPATGVGTAGAHRPS